MVCDTSEGIGGFAMRTKDSVYLVDNCAYEQKKCGEDVDDEQRERETERAARHRQTCAEHRR